MAADAASAGSRSMTRRSRKRENLSRTRTPSRASSASALARRAACGRARITCSRKPCASSLAVKGSPGGVGLVAAAAQETIATSSRVKVFNAGENAWMPQGDKRGSAWCRQSTDLQRPRPLQPHKTSTFVIAKEPKRRRQSTNDPRWIATAGKPPRDDKQVRWFELLYSPATESRNRSLAAAVQAVVLLTRFSP
jgi:hypothetical protein